MKVNKNIWVGKNKPYNKNSLHFPNGIDSGSSGNVPSGGIPNVPTVECWKITLSSLSDEDMKRECTDTIKNFFIASTYSVCHYGKCIIFSGTESDGTIYGGMGPEIVYGSSYQTLASDIFYILIINVGNDYYLEDQFYYFKEMLNTCGEQISLSDFLSIAAQAQNYEDRNGYA